ncbi:CRISPR-associated helicase Cas3' [Salmonella enterica subsp. enterica]|nr:CRISPR-associated helicase Cas3' [Salmonella enterica subsp. enterica serovar Chester]ECG6859745.1 CRISPR-associated helicase Cas3' [Salmonella enterica subsp. enterica serovar Chester]ECQ6075549.1 CRISPR-associated helicase Cas3' [Salmonella enterica subsp. enterica serovar Chester]ECR2000959.1 CRISPR-associated helicase Cas3' [Salmonella enterica subsp. enterica serovar Chester]
MSDSFRQSIWQPTENIAEDYARDDGNATTECHTWFADSRKKALLAEVGVGTLDQLLMAVMPFRHQSLRLLGMRDKILLLDEVHAYDGYMVKLLEGLLRFHAAQGGSAIILSATLPAALREKLLNAFSDGAGFMSAGGSDNAGYPWLSHLTSSGLLEQPLATRPEVQRTVAVNWIQQRQEALDIIYRVVATGQCICWIRNTVDDALDTYQQLLHEGIVPEQDLLLFHSRFAFIDRIAIENKTLNWFGNNAPVSERRGKVLIATHTRLGEESVDVYLARKDIDGQLRPLVDEIDFCWEKSRLSVRKSWWQKNSGTFQCPDEETLACFRKRHHRPSGQVVLVSDAGEASYYSKRFGLVG